MRELLVAEAYARFEPPDGYTDADLSLIRAAFCSTNPAVLQYAGRVARQVSRWDKPLAVSLACSVDLVAAGPALHELFMCLSHRETIPEHCIGEAQWMQLLANLEPVENLDDLWVRTFVRDAMRVVPGAVVEFVKHRLQRRARTPNWSCEPMTNAFGQGDNLLSLPDSTIHFRSLLAWALERATDDATLRRFGHVIAALYGRYDRAFLDELVQWMSDGSARHAAVVAAVLREAHNEIVLDYPDVVHSVLTAAHAIGRDAVQRVSSSLHVATTSGVRRTTPGEPFPEDVRLKRHASEALRTLSRWHPAFGLYTGLLRAAQSGIDCRLREAEAMYGEDDVRRFAD